MSQGGCGATQLIVLLRSTTKQGYTPCQISLATQRSKPIADPLHEVLQLGARELLAKAFAAKLRALLTQYSPLAVNAVKAVARNGHLFASWI